MEKIIKIRSPREIFAMSWLETLKRKGEPEIQIESLPQLSDKLWGLSRKKLMVIAGRTSQAKTSLALQIAKDVAKQGLRVYFFSLEESEDDLIMRLFCNICSISNAVLLYQPEKYEQQAKEFVEFLKGLPLVITYKIGATIRELYEAIEDLPQPALVIIDYIQAIKTFSNDRIDTINNYVIQFRELCVKKNFCGILVSQINREAMEGKDKRPQIWQLKGSGVLEEHSDRVLLTYWDYFYSNKQERMYDFEIIIGKNKGGPTGTIKTLFYPHFSRFEGVSLSKEAKKAIEVFHAEEVSV